MAPASVARGASLATTPYVRTWRSPRLIGRTNGRLVQASAPSGKANPGGMTPMTRRSKRPSTRTDRPATFGSPLKRRRQSASLITTSPRSPKGRSCSPSALNVRPSAGAILSRENSTGETPAVRTTSYRSPNSQRASPSVYAAMPSIERVRDRQSTKVPGDTGPRTTLCAGFRSYTRTSRSGSPYGSGFSSTA